MASITACLCGKVSDGCVELKACFCYSETVHPFFHGMEHYNFHASNMRSSIYVLCSISLCMPLFAGTKWLPRKFSFGTEPVWLYSLNSLVYVAPD